MLKTDYGTECPFSVEVVATATFDEDKLNMGSCSISLSNHSTTSYVHHSGSPALVPAGSCSESENSDEDEESITASTLDVVKNVGVTAEDVGMIDCLSDQFSNLFCSGADQPDAAHRSAGDATKPDAYHLSSSCTELQLLDLLNAANPGQFWMSPSEEDNHQVIRQPQTPQNRVASRKRKSAYVQQLWNNWYSEKTIPIERSKSMPSKPTPSMEDLQFDTYYDSDPEQEHKEPQFRREALKKPTRLSFRYHRPSPVQTIYEEECCSFDDYKPCPPTPRNSAGPSFDFVPPHFDTPMANIAAPSFFDSPAGLAEFHLMHPDGDDFLRDFVQEVTNARIKLVWHRHAAQDCATSTRPTLRAPLAVTGAFEVGAHLDQMVVQPKFTWSPAYESNLENRKFHLSGGEPDSIELLSIVRVICPQTLDRKLYPFARIDRSCCISTNDEEFPFLVFEAKSTPERDWLVTSLKMIVARLASIIIVRDEAMLQEFFSPYSALMSLADREVEEDDYGNCDDGHPSLEPNGELHLLSYHSGSE